MANGIPTSIPFLEAAYRQRPIHPDTGSQSFFRAFERARQERIEAPMREVQLKVAQQQMQLNALKLVEALRNRDDQIQAEGALTVFADRVRRAKLLGPSEPSGVSAVMEWVQSNRGLLTLPAGKAIWEDYLSSIEEDRKHKAQLEELRVRGDIQLQTQAAMGERQLDVEQLRQQGRKDVEAFKADRREDLTRLKASLSISESGKVVTPTAFTDRHLNTVLKLMPHTSDPITIQKNVATATQWLLDTFDEKLADLQTKTPVPPQTPPAAMTYSTKEEVVSAFKAGKLSRTEAARILSEQFGVK